MQIVDIGLVEQYGAADHVRPKRSYEPPDRADGTRVLVDRLWPRGLSKDKAAVDKVCAEARSCTVVVVSGRPLIIDPPQLASIDALVAAWLPGSEGAGVADTLFGRRAFTGKLPMTWPRTLAQEPINVGDADYDPLYPYGYGLRASR